jgi:ketosteroid isomerase-like protein
MSQENVEAAKRGLAAFNAGDWDTVREGAHPDLTLRTAEGFIDSGPFIGREAVLRWQQQARETWPDILSEPISDYSDVGDHVVVRMRVRGTGTGPDMTLEYSEVFTYLDGKTISIEMFWDHREALTAVGLEE